MPTFNEFYMKISKLTKILKILFVNFLGSKTFASIKAIPAIH
jgi:hypothetical protein